VPGAAGFHEIAAQGAEVGQTPHARENGPGTPLAGFDGAVVERLIEHRLFLAHDLVEAALAEGE
jgi:hypothetical protein